MERGIKRETEEGREGKIEKETVSGNFEPLERQLLINGILCVW